MTVTVNGNNLPICLLEYEPDAIALSSGSFRNLSRDKYTSTIEADNTCEEACPLYTLPSSTIALPPVAIEMLPAVFSAGGKLYNWSIPMRPVAFAMGPVALQRPPVALPMKGKTDDEAAINTKMLLTDRRAKPVKRLRTAKTDDESSGPIVTTNDLEITKGSHVELGKGECIDVIDLRMCPAFKTKSFVKDGFGITDLNASKISLNQDKHTFFVPETVDLKSQVGFWAQAVEKLTGDEVLGWKFIKALFGNISKERVFGNGVIKRP